MPPGPVITPTPDPITRPIEDPVVPGAGTPDEGHLYEVLVLDEGPEQGCSADIWDGSDTDQRRYQCSRRGRSGPFLCICEGEIVETDEESCVEALRVACDVDADPASDDFSTSVPPTHCEDFFAKRSTCWVNGENSFICRCLPDQDIFVVGSASCAQALFESCSESCSGEIGACKPVPEAGADHYVCDCDYYRAVRQVTGSYCQQAVDRACNPGAACNGDLGYCDVLEDGSLDCMCTDGNEPSKGPPPPGEEYICPDMVAHVCFPYV